MATVAFRIEAHKYGISVKTTYDYLPINLISSLHIYYYSLSVFSQLLFSNGLAYLQTNLPLVWYLRWQHRVMPLLLIPNASAASVMLSHLRIKLHSKSY